MPFGIAVTFARGTPKTSATCSRMKSEQVITWSAARTIRRSTPWMCDCGCLSTQP